MSCGQYPKSPEYDVKVLDSGFDEFSYAVRLSDEEKEETESKLESMAVEGLIRSFDITPHKILTAKELGEILREIY